MGVAIIGSGISGVVLALRLQQLGVEATLFSDRTPDEIRAGRLPNTVGRFDHTLKREAALGIDHWPLDDCSVPCIHFAAGPPLSVSFLAWPDAPLCAVDFRVLLPRWIEDFADRGGDVVVAPTPTDEGGIAALAGDRELAVVAVGRASVPSLFPVDPARSPYREPQRLVFAGLFEGLAFPDPFGLSFTISPGVGEVFQMPFLTAEGRGTTILMDAVPGGPLAEVVTHPTEDPAFAAHMADALRVHAPDLAARIDPGRFALRGPLDSIQGAITPAVRRAFATLSNGTPVLAIGDAWITNDPLTAQGANLGSHCAWVAAEHIAAGGRYDAAFGTRLEDAMWEFAGPVCDFSNGFLQPPPPHVIRLMTAAGEHQAVADAFASGFGDPVRTAALLADPDATNAFLDSLPTAASAR